LTLFVYNCLVGLLSIVAVPYLALRARAKGTPWGRIPEKFGFLPLSLVQTGSGAIWLHAVSVGEALAAGELLRALRTRFPQTPILVSTATPTGQTVAAERLADFADGFFYAPLDFKGAVRRTLRAIRPGLLIVMETEIWPNLFSETARHGAGVMIVNARISDRSAPSYRRWKGLFGPVLEFADRILAQSELDRERFIAAGADARRVKTAGNLKYDFEPGSTALPDAFRRFL
jgi:3-deoxy-D-manno-octulosonic-acid transferase